MDYNEFAQRIKNKYPEYKDMDNKELSEKIIAKYPEYKSQVTFENINSALKEKKGIDITPSGLARKVAIGISTPIRQVLYKESPEVARDKATEQIEAPFSGRPLSKGQGVSNLINTTAFAADVSPYFTMPQLNAVKGVGLGAKAANLGLTGAYQSGIAGGLESLKQEGDLSGVGTGSFVGGATSAALPVGGKVVSMGLNSPIFKNSFSGVTSLTSSVPYEYIQRALDKELAGKSILKGKFDTKDLNQNYYEAGQKAINGLKELELQANKNLNIATKNLNNYPLVDREQLTQKLVNQIDNYANSGTRNSALDEKGKDIYNFLEQVANDTDNVSLDATKDQIQNLVKSKYGAESGAGINALKEMGHTIKETLDTMSPEYALANENRAKLFEIKDTLNGLNKKTIATKLRNADTDANVRNAYNQAAEELDSLVSPENKFLEDVRDLRARESLEQWYPGQYGGMGSQSGVANLVRGGAAITGLSNAALTHNPLLAPITVVSMSPKLGAKNSIRAIGALNNFAANENKFNKTAQRLLPPVMAQNPLLYGQVEYNEGY